MERKLASIQKIHSIQSIENADAIERIDVLGWHCVAKKGEFRIGDLCVYCEIDSILPEKPEFEFLRSRKFRISTIKLRGQVSQGICFPLDILINCNLPNGNEDMIEGKEVTEYLGITKYEKPIPIEMGNDVAGHFPNFIPKTDEIRIQTVPKVIDRHNKVSCYVTEKVDGTSMTAWTKDGIFGVAGRNYAYNESETNLYWRAVHNTHLKDKMLTLNRNIAVQGEVLGPIQGNKYNIKEPTIYFFSAYDIDKQAYLSFEDFRILIRVFLDLHTVPVIEERMVLEYLTIDSLVELSKGISKLNPNTKREGIVIRSLTECQDEELGRLSFKVINPDFLLKYSE